MNRLSFFLLLALISLVLISAMSVQAQTARLSTINVTSDGERVHIAAQGYISELRVDVADEQGEVVFQSGAISGNALDWNMRDSAGERVAAGTYMVTVTYRNAPGKLRKRVEQVTVEEAEKSSPKPTAAPQAAQATITGAGTNGKIAKFTGASTIGNSVITESAGRIGIGITTPTSVLYVRGTTAIPSIIGFNTVSGIGVSGTSTGNYGLSGKSTSSNGVYGTTAGGLAFGGVSGFSSNGSGNGVLGEANGSSASGVRGQSTGINGVGVIGDSTRYIGVYGLSSSGDGVWGLTSTGRGVRGISTNNYGVSGETSGGGGVSGVYGLSSGTSGNGVIGEANNGSSAYGVWGKSTSGDAGHFSGDVDIIGNLSKSTGTFKIDHPLDPANKYLLHSFVESPDMMNIYNGNIMLDENGEAVVTMPRWFNALNKEFRYQLTAIGAPGPNLYIGEKMKGNQFKIAGGTPGMEVSWQVTGIRKDAYAEAHRIQVEVDKSEKERGFYLHPELFGQPEERGIDWALRPEFMRQSKEREASPQQPADK